ncbi:MAG: hypothetical protein GY715_00630 [Planctomycetes bacterium]|nr:hypothetical protein [Planctomycetota bacterium]
MRGRGEAGRRGSPAGDGTGCDEDDGSVIDVLVVYTNVARIDAGGTAALEALIDMAVTVTNDAYVNSSIAFQLNAVHVAEVNYGEDGFYLDHLDRLRNPNDGYMDGVHQLRDEHRADLVALIVADTSAGGQAYLFGGEEYAFSVTTWDWAADFRILAHEIGHNQGCCHAPGDGGGCENGGLFDYSNGRRFNGNSGTLWRTVMAYDPGSVISNFSNPDVLFDGQPTGVPAGSPDSADNARTINETAYTIANYRLGCAVPATCFTEDCNDNDIRDECDIASGTSLDDNGNGIPDECEIGACCLGVSCASDTAQVDCSSAGGTFQGVGTTCAPTPCLPSCSADVSGNGQVDFNDILTVIGAWGPCGVPCPADLSGNGQVDFADVVAIIGQWGPCPSSAACCFLTGACLDTPETECLAQGGEMQGPLSTCATVSCQADACAVSQESCLEEHATGGCNHPACCAAVCATDVFCCDFQWDDLCAQTAGEICGLQACCLADGSCLEVTPSECTGLAGTPAGPGTQCSTTACGDPCENATGSCYEAHETPGCDDPACCATVCDIDSFCCDFNWDQVCADTAQTACDGP